ncbi:cell wall-associated NlpC family hydrolase [Paraburkholderia sp. HC6.4b]|uniref:hypothetical protein n=1 Tax=unclassified Paraburkholderia TaxID=2615204 RepID=UPI00160D7564|nr:MULTISPECIES: hypothetical protein [unclassified Paraburkholderia]MBB5409233.1 cell wall-associated NlpC family hydrolase [Paraburkholderia sp. HC6.4b]MBB5450961.1 cell wall-associated NlpC family hydrolase [Paraburkholderia sp. Kb1A]
MTRLSISIRLRWLAATAIALASLPVAHAGNHASAYCEPSLRASLVAAAQSAPGAVREDGSLYGMQRWNAWTKRSYFGVGFPGLLSCAYTVSAIFQGACHPIGRIASVSAVDAALSRWRKIDAQDMVQAGDIVFWRPRQLPVVHRLCGAHWHVGIATGNGRTVDNDWFSGKPENHGMSRLCVAFDHARRPPD